jgi:hypothetical protein
MNIKDARTILGVSRDCSLVELNKRYRILALRLHPDKNGDAPEYTVAFQELNTAYHTLLPGVKNEPNDTNNAGETTNANDTNYDAGNATTEPYANIFMNFVKSLFRPKCNSEKYGTDGGNQILLDLLHRIVHDYASASVNSALDALDPSVLDAMIMAATGKSSSMLLDDDYLEVLVGEGLAPRLLYPNGFKRSNRFAFVIHPLSQEYFKIIKPVEVLSRVTPPLPEVPKNSLKPDSVWPWPPQKHPASASFNPSYQLRNPRFVKPSAGLKDLPSAHPSMVLWLRGDSMRFREHA